MSQSSALGHSDESAPFTALLRCRHALVLQNAKPLVEGHSSLIKKSRTIKVTIGFTRIDLDITRCKYVSRSCLGTDCFFSKQESKTQIKVQYLVEYFKRDFLSACK